MDDENDVDGYNYRTKRCCFRKQLKLKALVGLRSLVRTCDWQVLFLKHGGIIHFSGKSESSREETKPV